MTHKNNMNTSSIKIALLSGLLLSPVCLGLRASEPVTIAPLKGRYLSSDFHNHTSYSGGSYSLGHVVAKGFSFGLDWMAESGHGGVREYDGSISGKDMGKMVEWKDTDAHLKGDPHKEGYMWRWQCLKDFSFPELNKLRAKHPGKLLFQELEWNVPGHEHADVCILTSQYDLHNPNADALAQFEYMFDNSDKDQTGGKEFGWIKSDKEGHAKTLEAIA